MQNSQLCFDFVLWIVNVYYTTDMNLLVYIVKCEGDTVQHQSLQDRKGVAF